MAITKNTKGLHMLLVVQIWIFISFVSISNGNVADSSGTVSISYEVVNETYTVNVTEYVTMSATVSPSMSNYSVPVSATPPLPSNCYRVCRCNSSVVVYATTIAYNMKENETLNMNMTMKTMSVNMTSSDASISPSPSIVSVLSTARANVTSMSYNPSAWPTPSSSVPPPFVCPNESCWEEIECRTHFPGPTMTPYDSMTISPASATTASMSSSVEPSCSRIPDCNGDCDGSAYMDCGICIEGETGVQSLRDCAGDCNGTAFNSSCGTCLLQGQTDPVLDCNNTCRGKATTDSCNVCTGGNTGMIADYLKDECDVCNGDNTSCAGCDNVPNSGLVYDACGVCGGGGTTCTEIMATVPQTIASSQPGVWVIGAGLDGGTETVCGLYHPETGAMVVNTTGSQRNLTHVRCEFQPWVNYTAGVYNLSVTIVHSDKSVKTNKSLPVYYYSRQDLSLISVIPNEVLKGDLPKYVTLNGSGFFDWKETVCYFGSQESSDVIYVDETHLQCKVAAVDTSNQFSVSLSMDGGLVRVGNADLTVYARAPNVTGVKFSETAAEILVSFDIEVDIISGDETCDLFFTSETVATLGNDPDCYMVNTQELEILLGYGANISINDNLVFKDNVVKSFGERYSRFLNGSFPVNPPDSPLKPTPVITGPDTLSSCGNLTLSGLQSYGGGGRPLIFKWVLESPNAGQDVTDITAVLNGLGQDADRVHIQGSLFNPGKTYEFKLQVANFLNPSSFEEVTHSIEKATDPVPALTLSSAIDLSKGVFVSEDLSIKAGAIVAPCVNNTKVDFAWIVTCTDASAKQKVESSASFQATKNQATLKVSQGVLTGGRTCTFNVTGSMNYDPSVKSSVTQEIKALSTPIEPAIFGGDRLIGRDSGEIQLDAESLTWDPDQTSQTLSCAWRCEVVGGGLCYSAVELGKVFFSSLSGCDTTVQSNHFEAGKSYKIIVDVSKGARSASATVTYTVVEGNPPDVWVDLASMKVKAIDRIELVGYYKISVEPAKVEWTSSQVQGFSVVDLSSLTHFNGYYPGEDSFVQLILPANFLKAGSKYRFKLTVNDGSKEGVASMDVEVRTGPTSGSFSVEPTETKALEEVTFKAKGWVTDSDAGPLIYTFGELIGKDVCETFGAPSPSPESEEIVSQGSGENNILQLCAVIIDKYDSYAIATFNITSNPPDASDLTPDALDKMFDSAIDDKLNSGDANAAVGALISITDTVLESNDTSAELKNNISQKAQQVILGILGSTSIDQDNAAPLLTAIVKTDAKSAGNSSGMAQAAVTILKGFDNTPLTNDKADGLFDWMGDLVGDSLENDTDLQEAIVDFLDTMADNLDEGLLPGDEREVSDERLGTVKVQYTTLSSEVVTSKEPGAATFDPGEALASQFNKTRKCGQGKTCRGVVLKLIQYKKDLISVDENNQDSGVEVDGSKALGIDFNDPVSGEKLTVSGLSKPLKITFRVPPAPHGKQLGCNFYDDKKRAWVKDGLTAIDEGNKTICESTHATFFAPSTDETNTTTAPPTTPAVEATPTEKEDTDMTGAIVGGVIGGIVFILLVVLGVWYCTKHKKKNSGRISPEDPLKPAPVD